jgi:hypothetical protein
VTEFEAVVQRYYGDRPVMQRIDAALRAAGVDPERPSHRDLWPFAKFGRVLAPRRICVPSAKTISTKALKASEARPDRKPHRRGGINPRFPPYAVPQACARRDGLPQRLRRFCNPAELTPRQPRPPSHDRQVPVAVGPFDAGREPLLCARVCSPLSSWAQAPPLARGCASRLLSDR